MTYKAKQSPWLTQRAEKLGITVEELRQELSRRSNLADKSKTGFAAVPKEQHIEASKKGGLAKARNRKNEVSN